MPAPGGDLTQDARNSFDEYYREHKDAVYRFAFHLTRNRDEADELFQETWLRVVKHLTKGETIRDFKAWIFAISANVHRDILRKKRVRRLFFQDTKKRNDNHETKSSIDDHPDRGMPEPDRADLGRSLRIAIAHLPENQRRIFILKEIEGYKQQEISTMLGIPEGTVKSLMHRAVTRLRHELKEYKEES